MKLVSRSIMWTVAAGLLSVSPAAADLLQITNTTVSPGSTGNVAVQMFVSQQNGVYPVVSAFDLTLTYLPSIVTPLSVSFGGFLGDIKLGEAFATSDLSQVGLVSLVEVSLLLNTQLDQLQQNAQVVNNMRIVPLGFINFQIVNAPNARSDVDFLQWTISDGNGNALPVTVSNGFVASTPEPASFLLLGLVVVSVVRALRRSAE